MKVKQPEKATTEPYEHPEDKAMRLQAEAESAQFGDEISSMRIDDLKRLLTIYADSDAERLLANLREWYWGFALPAKVEGKS